MPVSSETTSDTASLCSVIPMAERCLAPSSLARKEFSARGRKQAAANTLLPCTMTAPSCRGVLGSKMLTISSAVTRASILTPLSMYSCRPVFRMKTISAPTLRRDSASVARTISRTAIPFSSSAINRECPNKPPRPSCSRARRNSGWNTTGSATNSAVQVFSSSQPMVYRLKRSLTVEATTSTANPFKSWIARVPLISISSL